ncbi:hypothetical protein MRX96_019400 [Rhipicephalus microplus]
MFRKRIILIIINITTSGARECLNEPIRCTTRLSRLAPRYGRFHGNAKRKVSVDCKLGHRGTSRRDAPAHARMSWAKENGDGWPHISSFKVRRYENRCVGPPAAALPIPEVLIDAAVSRTHQTNNNRHRPTRVREENRRRIY